MTLINRWYQILQLLTSHSGITMNELQEQLSSSPQTIRKGIDLLNEELIGIAQVIQKKNQFFLEIQNFDEFDLIMAGSLKKYSDFSSASKRMAYMIKRFIETENYILIDDFAEELAVSRGTVHKDLTRLKTWIHPFHLEIVGTPNRGLRIKGVEFDLRMVHIFLVQDYYEEQVLKEETYTFIENLTKSSSISKQDVQLIPKTMAITIKRILAGKGLATCPVYYTNCVAHHPQIQSFLFHIEELYQISLSQVEQQFLVFPFMINTNDFQVVQEVDEMVLRCMYESFMQRIHQLVAIDLHDDWLFHEMKHHLLFLVNRLLFYIELNDLFLREIQKKYPFAYELAKIGLEEWCHILKRPFSAVECDYLALYIETALRLNGSSQPTKKIAVVCNTGKGTALLIKQQLRRVLGDELAISHFSESEYEEEDLANYFAVFTTIPLKNVPSNLPVIQLNQLFNTNWLRAEWEKIERKQEQPIKNIVIRTQSLPANQTYLALLEKMVSSLLAEQLVDNDFLTRIAAREEQQSTIFDDGIAFPHALNQGCEQPILVVGTIQHKDNVTLVEQDTLKPHLILLLAIPEQLTDENEEGLIRLYDQLFKLIQDTTFREELSQHADSQRIAQWLIEGRRTG